MTDPLMAGMRSRLEIMRDVEDFVRAYDRNSAEDHAIAGRLRERLYSELYRRERDKYPEWVDLGGDG